jgi:hypothetical protein
VIPLVASKSTLQHPANHERRNSILTREARDVDLLNRLSYRDKTGETAARNVALARGEKW